MTPQSRIKARFVEAAADFGVRILVRSRKGADGPSFYVIVSGEGAAIRHFIAQTVPDAWMTSGGRGEFTYGLPQAAVEKALRETELDSAWLKWNDSTAISIARGIREEHTFDRLPVLADALEEAGCTNAFLLDHCRSSAPHGEICWVVDLLLGKH